MTHYDTLGLTAEAKTDDVRDAYKRLALVLHPDRPRGDARAFLELKRAYDCLADGTLRERYDASLASRASRPLADVVDVEEMDVRTVSFASPENDSRVARGWGRRGRRRRRDGAVARASRGGASVRRARTEQMGSGGVGE